ncbi:MAG: GntR family transcriptional regulator [bacterium]|nr:MAG: GntR family transcriptional regulator [bacterium]
MPDPRDPIVQRLSRRLAAGGGEPVAHLIVEELWESVVMGWLPTGARLPTARQLAIALSVSPRSVERAYAELERRGVIRTRPGEGTFVRLDPPSAEEQERRRAFAALCREVVARTRELGFSLDDLLDALAEYRTVAGREMDGPEP